MYRQMKMCLERLPLRLLDFSKESEFRGKIFFREPSFPVWLDFNASSKAMSS